MTAGLVIFAALIGMALGSFLNVAISRLPRGESIIHPRSHCPACGRELFWWENIPVVSYIALGGKCRTCRASIGIRHLVMEAVTGAAAATAAAMALRGCARVG